MSVYLQKTIKFISYNTEYIVFVMYSIEYKSKSICKSVHSAFIYVLHCVLTLMEYELYMQIVKMEKYICARHLPFITSSLLLVFIKVDFEKHFYV